MKLCIRERHSQGDNQSGGASAAKARVPRRCDADSANEDGEKLMKKGKLKKKGVEDEDGDKDGGNLAAVITVDAVTTLPLAVPGQ